MKPISLGIIGCGIFARERHLPVIKNLKDKFQIVAVCNHTPKKAKEFCKLAGISDYVLDYRQLLRRKDIEAIDIVLPIHLNCGVVLDSLKAGKHVIAEKPIAGNILDARNMLRFPGKYPLVMMIAENFRYHKLFLRLKQLLAKGKIGKPYAMTWDSFTYFSRNNKYAKTKWRANPKHRGGFISDGGVHNVAAIRLLFGEIASVSALTGLINPDLGEIDTFSMQFKTKKGVIGLLNLFYSSKGVRENKIRILGDMGSITVESDKITISGNGRKDLVEVIRDDGGYTEEFVDFYNAVRKGRKVVSSFYEGYRDFEVINLALDSAEQEKTLHFPN